MVARTALHDKHSAARNRIGDVDKGWRFAMPAIVTLAIVDGFPLLFALIASFERYYLSGADKSHPFVGFTNYSSFVSDPAFTNALVNTIYIALTVVGIELLVGFLIAYLLALPDLGFRGLYLSVYLIPLLLSPVVVGLTWRLILHPDLGILNYLLGLISVSKVAWLGGPKTALASIIAVDVWHETSLVVLILYAGIRALPIEPQEAAAVDGAGPITILLRIVLPLMRPIILVAFLIRFISAIKTYDLVYIMTKGGPGTSTETLSYLIWRTGLAGPLDIGAAAAGSILLVIVVAGLSWVLLKATEQAETYY